MKGIGYMIAYIKKESYGVASSFKMILVALLTYYFGIGWGLLFAATINTLPSVIIKFN